MSYLKKIKYGHEEMTNIRGTPCGIFILEWYNNDDINMLTKEENTEEIVNSLLPSETSNK